MYQTKFNSLLSITIKELRMSRNLPLGAISNALNKTLSYSSKLENGKIALTIETLDKLSNLFYTTPTTIIQTAEKYRSLLFSTNQWFFLSGDEIKDFNDDLLQLEHKFYKEILPSSSQNLYQALNIDILYTPYYTYDAKNRKNIWTISPFFKFVLDN